MKRKVVGMNPKRTFKWIYYAMAALALVLGLSAAWFVPGGLREKLQTNEPDYWPTDGWKTATPESQGLDSGKLAEGILAIREQKIMVHNLMIIRHGYMVLNATFYPYDGQTVHDIASDTKSVMTTLIGIAVDQGKLRMDDKAVSFFPGRTFANMDARKSSITVGQLASMSSGLDCINNGDEETLQEMVASPDYVQFMLSRPVTWVPGDHFVYCSPAIHLLSPILQQATGIPALDFARKYLFEPLGIRQSQWEKDPQGYYDGWGDLSLLPQDMAKIGFLFLHKGQWDGQQVISHQWVEEATRAHIKTGTDPYGYGWWIDPAVEGAYRADGRGGQYIFVLPKWDMVLVTTGGGFEMNQIAQYLLASFGDLEKPLAANPAAVERLNSALAAIRQPDASRPVAALPEMAGQISGKTFVFDPNPATLISASFSFDGSAEAVLTYEAVGQPSVSHVLGLDGVFRFSPGPDGRPAAYRGEWIDDSTFALEYDGIANNDHSLFKFHYENDRVEVSVQETSHETGAQFVGTLKKP